MELSIQERLKDLRVERSLICKIESYGGSYMWIICGVLSVIFCVIGRIMVSKKKKNTACVLKVKQIFKLFIQCNTKNQCQFCCGIELTCLDGTDRVPRHANHICQLFL